MAMAAPANGRVRKDKRMDRNEKDEGRVARGPIGAFSFQAAMFLAQPTVIVFNRAFLTKTLNCTSEGVWGTEVPQRGPGAEPR